MSRFVTRNPLKYNCDLMTIKCLNCSYCGLEFSRACITPTRLAGLRWGPQSFCSLLLTWSCPFFTITVEPSYKFKCFFVCLTVLSTQLVLCLDSDDWRLINSAITHTKIQKNHNTFLLTKLKMNCESCIKNRDQQRSFTAVFQAVLKRTCNITQSKHPLQS